MASSIFSHGVHVIWRCHLRIVELRRVLLRAGEEVVAALVGVEVGADDAQVGDLGELGEVAVVRLVRRVVGDALRQQVVLQRLEHRRLRVAQVGVEVGLGEEEHLAVGLPHPVVLAPLPLLGRHHRRARRGRRGCSG